MQRRLVLQNILKLAGLSIYRPAWSSLPENKTGQFSLGVASGSPTTDGFTLWTRLIFDVYLETPFLVQWEVSDSVSFARIVAKGEAVALPELAHSVHVDVRGLKPDRWYWFRFFSGDSVSTIGRTRTLPSLTQKAEHLRFAYASCQRWDDGYYAAYRQMSQDDLDLVVFLGDYIYEKTPKKSGVRPNPLRNAHTLDDYRRRYALYKSDPNLQLMHAACPWLVTWDDHEVANDYAGDISVESDANHSQRRITAYQAYYEHMPLGQHVLLNGINGLKTTNALRIYDRYHFGRLAAFHLLDDRQYRSAPLCPPEQPKHAYVCAALDSDTRTMLGAEQEQWLDEGFEVSARLQTRWDIVAQQTVFGPRRYPSHSEIRTSADHWDGFATARQRLLDSIVKHQPKNTLFVGGDIHQNWVAHIRSNPLNDQSPFIASEFCGTSISSSIQLTQKHAEKIKTINPHCIFNNVEYRGYGVVDLTPKHCQVTLKAVADVTNPDSAIFTLARFGREDGSPLIFSE